ncbi:2'-5' RNA ligase [Roseomonas rosea]|uniref:2'-5' RNA ligase n=1 Tax=Muricoccus roseus TaxID=198092 RepID=A0A1M6N831_9PROT|nr:2'-5' RNA ligase family protein [Roseomonas rosea]SHJ91814.1 2'-5' RNA ligase [Roseomonas rosea]
MTAAPLILTLAFDRAAFQRLDALRRAHFPPERNWIPAHLTLFHALPGEELSEVVAHLGAVCARQAPLPLRFTGLRSLGRGVALEVEAPGLLALRQQLARNWAPWLMRQDAQGWRPHVTIQNKAAPEAVRALLQELSAGFIPWEAQGEGLLLWHYRGGPWEGAASLSFEG